MAGQAWSAAPLTVFPPSDVEMKKAAKLFAGKFAASSSLVGDDEIQIQGDHSVDLAHLIVKTFPQVWPPGAFWSPSPPIACLPAGRPAGPCTHTVSRTGVVGGGGGQIEAKKIVIKEVKAPAPEEEADE